MNDYHHMYVHNTTCVLSWKVFCWELVGWEFFFFINIKSVKINNSWILKQKVSYILHKKKCGETVLDL